MLAALLLRMVYFTLPAFLICRYGAPDATCVACEAVAIPNEGEVASLIWRSGVAQPDTGARHYVARSMWGHSDSLAAPSGEYVLYVISRQRGGRWSCISNIFRSNGWTTSVGPADAPPDTTLYDVAGRRVVRPLSPGIYFTKRGKVYIRP